MKKSFKRPIFLIFDRKNSITILKTTPNKVSVDKELVGASIAWKQRGAQTSNTNSTCRAQSPEPK